jgi:DNA repair protein RecN (Recombination protein N)
VSKVLDNFAGIDSSDLDNLKQKLQKVNRQLAEFETGKLSINEVEFYESQLEEIRSCKISSENELDELIKEQELLSESQKIISAAVEARTHLVSLDESGFSDAITEVSRAIGSIETLPKELAEGILQRLLSVRTEISDLAYDLNNIADKITLDSTYLDQISERIQMLKKLERKYGGTISQVLDTEKKLTATIDLAKNSTDSKQMLYREKELLEIQVTDLKTEITEQRRSAVKELQDTVLNYLKELALTEAQFEIRVEGAGSTDVEFLISTNISQGLHPISQVASGGELSRIMLALNLALKNGAKYVTDGAALIFDEVDTGIGGQTALNIGQSLAKLATKEQILVVTHLPQVAAFADSHFKISKTNSDTTEVIIEKLSDNLRAEEINRMLSGITGTESGLAHAKELLEAADMQKSNR